MAKLSECQDDENKERYLREYEETESIILDRNNIIRNPGLIAKLLNSFWGKFGQRINLPNTEIVKKYECLVTLFTSSEHEITNILPVNDEIIYVLSTTRREVALSPQTNPVIAAWTSQARLLYEYLEKLDSRVLYFDTTRVFT